MAYWLNSWLEVEGIKNLQEARRLLASPESVDRFYTAAEQDATLEIEWPEGRDRLYAGNVCNLSGEYDCVAGECLIERANELIRSSWHSFDSVMATGLDSRKVLRLRRDDAQLSAPWNLGLAGHIDLALYLREIGAYDIVEFSRRPGFCLEHLDQHAREAGLLGVKKIVKKLRSQLRKDAEFVEFNVDNRQVSYEVRLGELAKLIAGRSYWSGEGDPDRDSLLRYLVDSTVSEFTASTVASLGFARESGAALGQIEAPGYQKLIDSKNKGSSRVEDAALSIRFPTIDHVPMREVVAEMRRCPSELKALRSAVRLALRAKIQAADQTNANSEVANEAYRDLIEPRLIELERRADAAGRMALRSHAASILIGGAVTTVGLLAFSPVIIPGIAAATSGALLSQHNWLKEKKEIETSDLHFLWRLENKHS